MGRINVMPLELIYIWAVGLLVIVAALYGWLRLRRRRLTESAPRSRRDWRRWWTEQQETAAATPEDSVAALRGPVLALLVGGLLFVWLGQSIYSVVEENQRPWVFALMGLGGVSFLLGGRLAVAQHVPAWLALPVRRVAQALRVQPVQLILMLWALLFAGMVSLAAGFQVFARHQEAAVAAWLLAIAAAVLAAVPLRRLPALPVSRRELLVTAVLFLAALLLRGLATDVIPTTFSGDEGSAGLNAVMFLEDRFDNWFISGWFSFPSFYFALQSVGVRIWGQTIAALRIPSAFAGALAVVAVYWWTRSMFDRKTAVFAALYLTVSHYHIHISRIGLNNIWDSLWGALAMLGFWHGWKTGSRWAYALCGLALGLGQYFYVSIRVLPLIFLLWSLVAMITDWTRFRQRLPGMILAAFVSLVIVLPLGIYFQQFPNEFNAPLDRVTIMGERLQMEVATRNMSASAILWEQFRLALLGFTQHPLRLLYDPGAPLLLTGAAALFLVGLLWMLIRFDLRTLLLLLPLAAAVASNTMSQSPPASQRFILAMPAVAVLVAVPLGQMGNWLQALWPQRQWVGTAVAALLLAAVMVQDVHYYFFRAYDRYVLGGLNTQVATEVAYYLRDLPDQEVYFLGFPRMGYFSLSTIPYLAPQMSGRDIAEPLTRPPEWELMGPTLFIFLPERLNELELVQAAYPDGRFLTFSDSEGVMLFASYEVRPGG